MYAHKDLSKIELSDSEYSLMKLRRFDKLVCDATAGHVWLPCGGYLVIQPTEALTVIDVNSGKCMVKKDSETTAFKINLEAATIISKQLKLRNISGIIIIDFINMQQTTHQENLLKQLRSLV